MDNIIKLIEVIVWPAVVIIMAIMFRHELRKAAQRLSSLKYKDFSADFNANLSKIEGDLVKLTSSKSDEQQKLIENEQTLSSYERLLRIADISPRAAIMEAWRDIEVTTKQVTDVYGISAGGNIAGVKAIRQLVERGLLPPTVVSAYEGMRRLRARAAHAADFAIDPEKAERYIETAHQFFMTLSFLLNQAKKKSQQVASADS